MFYEAFGRLLGQAGEALAEQLPFDPLGDEERHAVDGVGAAVEDRAEGRMGDFFKAFYTNLIGDTFFVLKAAAFRSEGEESAKCDFFSGLAVLGEKAHATAVLAQDIENLVAGGHFE